ncbi:MAG: hypothetical protein U5R49_19510 [Deltaproteobacteria bacterium]|nr:hypothetical protein [Deltaproteobacteria bacterium]
MKSLTRLIGILLLLTACTTPTGLRPLEPSAASEHTQRCQTPFPNGDWQFVHAIEGTLPGGGNASAIGVTTLSAGSKTAHCILMTVEGFVLFDALFDGEITVNRAVPPFDKRSFAQGLLADIRFIFFPPEGKLIQKGTADDAAFVCRYRKNDGAIVDVMIPPQGGWEIHQYREGQRVRSVQAKFGKHDSDESEGTFPRQMTLSATRPRHYTLTFKLIEAKPITGQPKISQKRDVHSLRLRLPRETFVLLFHRGVSAR